MGKSWFFITIFLLFYGLLFFSCSDERADNGTSLGGQEYLLEGSWWISLEDDGVYFDGSGGGYDIDYYGYYCIDYDEPVEYTFDGEILSFCEEGTCQTGILVQINNDSATFSINGEPFIANRVTPSGSCN